MDPFYFMYLGYGILLGFIGKSRFGRIIITLGLLFAILLLSITPNGWASMETTSLFTHQWYENVIAFLCFYLGDCVGEALYDDLFWGWRCARNNT